MAIKLMGLVDLLPIGNKPVSAKLQTEEFYDPEKHGSSGEMGLHDESETSVKANVMALHDMTKEIYNLLEESDQLEEWVVGTIADCTAQLNAVHAHVVYTKKNMDKLDTSRSINTPREGGW